MIYITVLSNREITAEPLLQYSPCSLDLCMAATYRRISMKALARYQIILLGEQRHIGLNNLPKVVARQCISQSQESNLRPFEGKSSTLITTPPSHRYYGLQATYKKWCVHIWTTSLPESEKVRTPGPPQDRRHCYLPSPCILYLVYVYAGFNDSYTTSFVLPSSSTSTWLRWLAIGIFLGLLIVAVIALIIFR